MCNCFNKGWPYPRIPVVIMREDTLSEPFPPGANLLLDSIERNLCLADFGEAARLSDIEKFHTMAGTPPFMAPEVVRAKPTNRRYSQKCDVWSTGCVMIEMGTRHIPWMLNNFKYERWTILYKV